MTQPLTLLHIDSSARHETSVSRQLSRKIVEQISAGRTVEIIRRDVADGLPVVTQDWVGANFTPAADRTADQAEHLIDSQVLVQELQAADILVIGMPIYNFSVPAALKLWIDQICRAGLTFRYTANGPEGLLTGKKAYIALASGGTALDSDIDFAGRYIRHVLGFIGITDVQFIAADQLGRGADEKLETARVQIAALAA